MFKSIRLPQPEVSSGNTEGESEKVELRKKLLEMIRRNETKRRETRK